MHGICRDRGSWRRTRSWWSAGPPWCRTRPARVTRASSRTRSTSPSASAGAGSGTLLTELCALADSLGIWTIQAGIFPENEASLALHERCGFRRVGVRERIGQLDGAWRDVVLLERRVP